MKETTKIRGDVEFQLTDEQLAIIDAVVERELNVVVNAVAGSGKTTTSLKVAWNFHKKHKECQILLLTFSKKLRDQVWLESKMEGCARFLTVKTFHSFAGMLFRREGVYNNEKMEECLKESPPEWEKKFRLIIVDEAQDMTLQYCRLIKAIHKHASNSNNQWLILGDVHQTIFDTLHNSDSRFLTHFPQMFESDQKWVNLNLSESFRLTQPMVNFLNKYIIKKEFFRPTKKEGPKVLLLQGSKRWMENQVANKLEGVPNEHVMIVSPTIKEGLYQAPRELSCFVSARGKCVYYSEQLENGGGDSRNIERNKIPITSIHKVKGREAKLVVVYDFADRWTSQKVGKEGIHNLFYVALTRAKQELIICSIQDPKSHRLTFPGFFDVEGCNDQENVVFLREPGIKISKASIKEPDIHISTQVTSLVSYLNWNKLTGIRALIEMIRTDHASDDGNRLTTVSVDVKRKIKQDVSQINAEWFCCKLFKQKTGVDLICDRYSKIDEWLRDVPNFISKSVHIPANGLHLELFKVNAWLCANNRESSNLNQIVDYGWLEQDDGRLKPEVSFMLTRLMDEINGEIILFEQKIDLNSRKMPRVIREIQKKLDLGNIKWPGLSGRLDVVVDNSVIYELKCINSELSPEHMLQAIVYLYIINSHRKIRNCDNEQGQPAYIQRRNVKEIILFNICTGQKIALRNDSKIVDQIIELLYRAVLERELRKENDEDFMSEVKKALSEVL